MYSDGALYTATVGDSAGRDSVIYRSSVGQPGVVELESKEIDVTWFNCRAVCQRSSTTRCSKNFFRYVGLSLITTEYGNSLEIISV